MQHKIKDKRPKTTPVNQKKNINPQKIMLFASTTKQKQEQLQTKNGQTEKKLTEMVDDGPGREERKTLNMANMNYVVKHISATKIILEQKTKEHKKN